MPKSKPIEQQKSANASNEIASIARQSPVRRVSRSQINLAEYNPRILSAYAQKQLAKSLQKFGLVETPVWNEATGVLVSGHQRLKLLDSQHNYPAADYTVEVSVVNLTPHKERQLNVWLNNRSAQGQFDEDLFRALFASDPKLTIDDLGFTRADLDLEFGNSGMFADLFERENSSEADGIVASAEAIAEHRQKTREKRTREEKRQDSMPESDTDYYLVVTFGSAEEKRLWLRAHGFQAMAKYLSHAEYEAAVGSAAERREVTAESAEMAG